MGIPGLGYLAASFLPFKDAGIIARVQGLNHLEAHSHEPESVSSKVAEGHQPVIDVTLQPMTVSQTQACLLGFLARDARHLSACIRCVPVQRPELSRHAYMHDAVIG